MVTKDGRGSVCDPSLAIRAFGGNDTARVSANDCLRGGGGSLEPFRALSLLCLWASKSARMGGWPRSRAAIFGRASESRRLSTS